LASSVLREIIARTGL